MHRSRPTAPTRSDDGKSRSPVSNATPRRRATATPWVEAHDLGSGSLGAKVDNSSRRVCSASAGRLPDFVDEREASASALDGWAASPWRPPAPCTTPATGALRRLVALGAPRIWGGYTLKTLRAFAFLGELRRCSPPTTAVLPELPFLPRPTFQTWQVLALVFPTKYRYTDAFGPTDEYWRTMQEWAAMSLADAPYSCLCGSITVPYNDLEFFSLLTGMADSAQARTPPTRAQSMHAHFSNRLMTPRPLRPRLLLIIARAPACVVLAVFTRNVIIALAKVAVDSLQPSHSPRSDGTSKPGGKRPLGDVDRPAAF